MGLERPQVPAAFRRITPGLTGVSRGHKNARRGGGGVGSHQCLLGRDSVWGMMVVNGCSGFREPGSPKGPPSPRLAPGGFYVRQRGRTGKRGKLCGHCPLVRAGWGGMTDTNGMRNRTVRYRCLVLAVSLVAGIVAAVAVAGGHHCGRCGGSEAGTPYPYGDLGCGPRYCGPEHWRDPCDACGRWVGCNGVRQGPELLAPWQLPPGRGFTPPAALGYGRPIGVCGEGAPCSDCRAGGECHACGPRHGWGRLLPSAWF